MGDCVLQLDYLIALYGPLLFFALLSLSRPVFVGRVSLLVTFISIFCASVCGVCAYCLQKSAVPWLSFFGCGCCLCLVWFVLLSVSDVCPFGVVFFPLSFVFVSLRSFRLSRG